MPLRQLFPNPSHYRFSPSLVALAQLVSGASWIVLSVGGCLFLIFIAATVEEVIRAPETAAAKIEEELQLLPGLPPAALHDYRETRSVALDQVDDPVVAERIEAILKASQGRVQRNRILATLVIGGHAVAVFIPFLVIGLPGIILGRIFAGKSSK